MNSYEGAAKLESDGLAEPLVVTLIIDDLTSPSWVGIIRLVDESLIDESTGAPARLSAGDEVRVVLHSGAHTGLMASARIMVPSAGLPTLRGRTAFAPEAASCGAGA